MTRANPASTNTRMLTLTVGTLLLMANCSVIDSGKISGPSAAAERQASAARAENEPELTDEESGIDGITAQLKSFNRALEKKEFEKAGKLLRRVELAVERADELTQGHPEFDDKVEATERAQTRYEEALERDRIDRRNAAIVKLIAEDEEAIGQGLTLTDAMENQVPDEDDIAELETVVQHLKDLASEGLQYASQSQYRLHAERRDRKLVGFENRLKVAKWQLSASNYLDDPVQRGLQAIATSDKTKNSTKRIEALQLATGAFTQCIDQMEELAGREDYDPKRLVETRLGELSLVETQEECQVRYTETSKRLETVRWTKLVTSAIKQVTTAMRRFNRAGTAQKKLEIQSELGTTLAACETQMQEATTRPGYGALKAFRTPFGELTVSDTQAACHRRRESLAEDEPTLVWQAELEDFAESLKSMPKRVAKAEAEQSPKARAIAWKSIVDRFESCGEVTSNLAERDEATPRFQVTTVYGVVTVRDLQEECALRLTAAKEGQSLAEENQALDELLKTAQNDEVRVAKRRGVPTRVQKVEGGRIFVYENDQEESEHIGFDRDGRRYDYEEAWSNKFREIAENASASLNRINNAEGAAQLNDAVRAGLLVFRDCSTLLRNAHDLPGADATQTHQTAFGEVTAEGLQRFCELELRKYRGQMPALEWQTRLEAVGQRAQEAARILNDNPRNTPSGQRSAALQQVIVIFKECAEQAEALAEVAGADEALTVAGPGGSLTRSELIDACNEEKERAEETLDTTRSEP